jgi:hypothetical protein
MEEKPKPIVEEWVKQEAGGRRQELEGRTKYFRKKTAG